MITCLKLPTNNETSLHDYWYSIDDRDEFIQKTYNTIEDEALFEGCVPIEIDWKEAIRCLDGEHWLIYSTPNKRFDFVPNVIQYDASELYKELLVMELAGL